MADETNRHGGMCLFTTRLTTRPAIWLPVFKTARP